MWFHFTDVDTVGLAAPQLGICEPIILVYGVPMIKPKIIKKEGAKVIGVEGCKSIPNKLYKVNRWSSVHVEFVDYYGNLKTAVFNDFHARIVQHEIDHLHGILIDERGTLID
jgi:peptide deformylase